MKTEYRLVIDKTYTKSTHPKKDLEHAQKGVEDAYRDFQRYQRNTGDQYGMSAWVETRTVTEWEKT